MTQHDHEVSKSMRKHIRYSEKPITILFTDVVASVKHWDSRGDMEGRLLIDYLNRLVFPIVKKYRGKVVKTIGDALMVSFKKPANSIRAAIAIQQKLHSERRINKKLPLVRIGIHTGRAIVEKKDVYGNMVNVASRIENRAKGNEILMSTRTVRKVGHKNFPLEKKDRFTPKGKKRAITVYKCNWRKAPDLIDKLKYNSLLPVKNLQKWEIIGASLASLLILAVLFFKYIRYFLSDSEVLALLTLNPKQLVGEIPLLLLFPLVSIVLIVFFILRMKKIPVYLFKIVNGGLGFCLGFFLFYLPVSFFKIDVGFNADAELYSSEHLFVEIIATTAPLYEEPDTDSTVLRTVPRGMLLLLSDVREKDQLAWNKVLIGRKKYGWILRVVPARLGVPEERVSIAKKFYLKIQDIYNILFGIIGFIIGFFRFRIRPI